MTVEIERLTPQRLDDALELHATVFGNADAAFRQDIAGRLAAGTGVFFIAVDRQTDKVVGLKFANFHGEGCIGSGIAVLPEYRRRGIATQLLRHFQEELATHPEVKFYAFGSGTTEGIPFHLASGYAPRALIQFNDPQVRPRLDLTGLKVTQDGYNQQHKVYQIHVELSEADRKLEALRRFQERFPEVNVQFMFYRQLRA